MKEFGPFIKYGEESLDVISTETTRTSYSHVVWYHSEKFQSQENGNNARLRVARAFQQLFREGRTAEILTWRTHAATHFPQRGAAL